MKTKFNKKVIRLEDGSNKSPLSETLNGYLSGSATFVSTTDMNHSLKGTRPNP